MHSLHGNISFCFVSFGATTPQSCTHKFVPILPPLPYIYLLCYPVHNFFWCIDNIWILTIALAGGQMDPRFFVNNLFKKRLMAPKLPVP